MHNIKVSFQFAKTAVFPHWHLKDFLSFTFKPKVRNWDYGNNKIAYDKISQQKNWDGFVTSFIIGFDLEIKVELIVNKDHWYHLTSMHVAPFLNPSEWPLLCPGHQGSYPRLSLVTKQKND